MPHYTPTSPVVSVLMAVHDAGKTVRRAVESLQNQTLANFELIVVDRGSADGTTRALDALAERDMRLELLRAERCGRQEALNLALARARGTYLTVMDADAWADPTLLARLVGAADQGSLELVIGGFSLALVSGSGRVTQSDVSSAPMRYPTQHDFRADAWRLLASGQLLPTGGKLFSRSRVEELGLRFSPARGTDHSFVMDYLADVERVAVLEGVGYHVMRPVSTTRRTAALENYAVLEEEHAELLALFRHWGLDGDAASVEALQGRYLEQLVECVDEVCGWRSRLPSSEQRRIVAKMIDTDRAQLAASVAHPQGNAARSLLAPIRARNAALVCVQTRLVSLFRRGVADLAPDAFI